MRLAMKLAPDFFRHRPHSIRAINERLLWAKSMYMTLRPSDPMHKYLNVMVQDLEIALTVLQHAGFQAEKLRQFEELKVEVQLKTRESAHGLRNMPDDELAKLNKRELFRGVAEGLANSGEVDKFIYTREYGELKVIGIRLYVKHEQ